MTPDIELPPPRPRSWNYWDILVVVVFAFAAQIVVFAGAMVLMLLYRQARGGTFSFLEAMSSAKFILAAQFFWWLLIFWIVYRIVRARDPRPFREAIAWTSPTRPSGHYLAAGVLLALSVALLAKIIPMPNVKTPMEMLFQNRSSAFLLAAFGVFIAPLVEEMLFRGFFFPVIQRAHGSAAAVLVTGFLFALVHAQQYGWAWQNILILGYVGCVFGAVRAVTRSLIPSTLMHAAYNLTLFSALYAASNRFRDLNF